MAVNKDTSQKSVVTNKILTSDLITERVGAFKVNTYIRLRVNRSTSRVRLVSGFQVTIHNYLYNFKANLESESLTETLAVSTKLSPFLDDAIWLIEGSRR